MNDAAKLMIAITLFSIPTIEYGGTFLLSLWGRSRKLGSEMSQLQHAMFRAGHAHAGVLVILGLICQLLVQDAVLAEPLAWFVRIGVVAAPIMVSAGFFLSATSPKAEKPGAMIRLVYLGAALLAVCLVTLGLGLLTPPAA